MEWLAGNSFFALLFLICAGMHLFGHGHQHGKHSDDETDSSSHDAADHHRREM